MCFTCMCVCLSVGAQPADKAKIFPFQRVLREGDSAMFCCVPSHGDHVSDITLNDKKYPLINVGTAVRAISVQNLTIPTFVSPIKVHCDSQRPWSVWNYVSCRFNFLKIQFLSSTVCVWRLGSCVCASCSSFPEAQKPQLRDLRLENYLLQLGLRQKTEPAWPQQPNDYAPHSVSKHR